MVVPWAGLEPARSFEQEILSLRCLPFHHQGNLAATLSKPSAVVNDSV